MALRLEHLELAVEVGQTELDGVAEDDANDQQRTQLRRQLFDARVGLVALRPTTKR